jgi:hypothetical protein
MEMDKKGRGLSDEENDNFYLLSVVNCQMKSQITFGVINGLLMPIISFFISFIVGVFILHERFPGSDYFGAVIYFPYISIAVSIIFPYLTIKKENVMEVSIIIIVFSSVLAGIIFCIIAFLINKIYLLNIDNFQKLNGGKFELMIGYDVSYEAVMFCGFVLFLVILIMSLMRRKV